MNTEQNVNMKNKEKQKKLIPVLKFKTPFLNESCIYSKHENKISGQKKKAFQINVTHTNYIFDM